MKKIVNWFLLVLVVSLLASGCATQSAKTDPDKVYELVILHTNDHHGTVVSTSEKPGKGGLAQRATYIKSVRALYPNVLLLDAGDINTGTAVSNMFKAEPDIKAYNLMNYDAVAFGNHEFDNPLELLKKQIDQSTFAWINANILQANGKTLTKPYLIKKYEGIKVGIFGLTTLRTIVNAQPDKSLKFADEIETAKKMVEILRNKEKVDIVIALTHLGSVLEAPEQTTSVKLAEAVTGIDLIIDGHSHTKMDEPLMVNGTPIVSANEWGKFVGKGVIQVKGGKILNFSWSPAAITADVYAPDPEMEILLKPYIDQAKADLGTVVMTTTDKFEFGNRLSRYQEIALGNMVNDGVMWYMKNKLEQEVDFAFTNGGNIRTELPAGPVTKENIATVLPFDNWIFVLTMKGSDLIELFNFIGSINQGNGGWAQMSKEVRYTITYTDKGTNGKIAQITINGKPIDPDKNYKVATNDYLAGGGDGYSVLKKCTESYNTSATLRDITIEYVQQLPQPVNPAKLMDGRITLVGGIVNP